MDAASVQLEQVPDEYAIARLPADAELPAWAAETLSRTSDRTPLISLTRTDQELSIVAPNAGIPPEISPCERGYRALRVKGTLDFNLVGVLAHLTARLADAGIPVFVISTFDTDYLLVKEQDLDAALRTLQ